MKPLTQEHMGGTWIQTQVCRIKSRVRNIPPSHWTGTGGGSLGGSWDHFLSPLSPSHKSALHSCDLNCHSAKTGLLAFLLTCQVPTHLRTFALNVPAIWNLLPPGLPVAGWHLIMSLSSNVTSLESSSLNELPYLMLSPPASTMEPDGLGLNLSSAAS